MLHNVLLKADIQTEMAKQGKFINVVLAAGEINARIRYDDGGVLETKLVSGMAFPVPKGFVSVGFSSDISQQCKIWLGFLPLTYSPNEQKVVGSSSMQSLGVNLFYNQITEILPARSGRGKLTLQADKDFRLGGVGSNLNNSIKIAAGTLFEFSTQGAVFGYSVDTSDLSKVATNLGATPQIDIAADVMNARVDNAIYNPVTDEVITPTVSGYYRLPASTLATRTQVNLGGYNTIHTATAHPTSEGFYLFGTKLKVVWAIYISFANYSIISEVELGTMFFAGIQFVSVTGERVLFSDSRYCLTANLDGTNKQITDVANDGLTHVGSGVINLDGEIVLAWGNSWAVTPDYGVTWNVGAFPAAVRHELNSISVDPVTGNVYVPAAGGLGFYESFDGGRSWVLVAIPSLGFTNNPISALKVINGHVYAANNHGFYYYNSDNGEWVGIDLNQAYFAVNLTVGTNGVVYLMSAGGSATAKLASIAGDAILVGGMQVNVLAENN
jgi:hypothetical protein